MPTTLSETLLHLSSEILNAQEAIERDDGKLPPSLVSAVATIRELAGEALARLEGPAGDPAVRDQVVAGISIAAEVGKAAAALKSRDDEARYRLGDSLGAMNVAITDALDLFTWIKGPGR